MTWQLSSDLSTSSPGLGGRGGKGRRGTDTAQELSCPGMLKGKALHRQTVTGKLSIPGFLQLLQGRENTSRAVLNSWNSSRWGPDGGQQLALIRVSLGGDKAEFLLFHPLLPPVPKCSRGSRDLGGNSGGGITHLRGGPAVPRTCQTLLFVLLVFRKNQSFGGCSSLLWLQTLRAGNKGK